MHDRAADRATVACLHVADPLERAAHERQAADGVGIALDHALADRCADDQRIVAHLDVLQLVEAVDVDQPGRSREAHGHHGNEALSAGDELGVAAMLGEQFAGFGEGGDSGVFEGGGFHGINDALHCSTWGGRGVSLSDRDPGIHRLPELALSYQIRFTPYFTNTGSAVTTGSFSSSAWAINNRSNGSP